MVLYLIRHGKTQFNDERRYQGFIDTHLSDKGKEEILSLKQLYKNVPNNSHFFVSGLVRTHETLKLLFGDVGNTIDPRLNELNFGDFEGLTHYELVKKKEYIDWIKNPMYLKVPNGECGNDQKNRVEEALKEIINKYKGTDETVVIVSHSGSIYYMYGYLTKDPAHMYDHMIDNGKGYKITILNDEVKQIDII